MAGEKIGCKIHNFLHLDFWLCDCLPSTGGGEGGIRKKNLSTWILDVAAFGDTNGGLVNKAAAGRRASLKRPWRAADLQRGLICCQLHRYRASQHSAQIRSPAIVTAGRQYRPANAVLPLLICSRRGLEALRGRWPRQGFASHHFLVESGLEKSLEPTGRRKSCSCERMRALEVSTSTFIDQGEEEVEPLLLSRF